MTDRTDHYAESESLAATAGIRDSVDRMYATKTDIYLAAIHKSLLAIADALTAADRYAANEAKQREAESDPLDENDHRDRVMSDGGRIIRNGQRHWHRPLFTRCAGDCGSALADWNRRFGPLAFAPDAVAGRTYTIRADGELVDNEGRVGVYIPDPASLLDGAPSAIRLAVNAKSALMAAQLRQVISSVQDSGDLAEFDALADAWEAGTNG